jgi:chlorite dismutase
MDLGRSKHYTFCSLKNKSDNNYFFLANSTQTGAKVYEHAQARQCHRAYVIEQPYFAVILHSEATSGSLRFISWDHSNKKNQLEKSLNLNMIFFFFFVLDIQSFFGVERHKY